MYPTRVQFVHQQSTNINKITKSEYPVLYLQIITLPTLLKCPASQIKPLKNIRLTRFYTTWPLKRGTADFEGLIAEILWNWHHRTVYQINVEETDTKIINCGWVVLFYASAKLRGFLTLQIREQKKKSVFPWLYKECSQRWWPQPWKEMLSHCYKPILLF